MRPHWALFLVLLGHAAFGQEFTRSTVSVAVTGQDFDYYSPWKKGSVTRKALTGCVLPGERILTLSRPLANHILIEVSKSGNPRKWPAEVLLADYNNGLALLTVKEKGFFSDLAPVDLLPSGPLRGRARVVRWDPAGNLRSYVAEAFNTSIEFYGVCGAVLLHHMVAALDSGGNGELVFLDRRLAGITLSFDNEHKTIKVCAVDNIKRMLQDLDDGKYDGMPFFVVDHVPLNGDENLRNYLGLGPSETGVLVTNVHPKTSGHAVLKPNDVILSIDGVTIDDKGLYDSGLYGKLNYYGVLSLKHSVGDKVAMEVFRDRKRTEVSFELLPMTNDCYLIPLSDFESPPRYYVYGGLVFQELTEGYVTAWGKNVDKRLMFLFDTQKLSPSPERSRCVILNRTLPAAVNMGYHNRGNLVLLAVNGTPVRDLKHFKALVEGAQGRFLKFDFQGDSDIVLDRQWVQETNDIILKKYNITAQSNITE